MKLSPLVEDVQYERKVEKLKEYLTGKKFHITTVFDDDLIVTVLNVKVNNKMLYIHVTAEGQIRILEDLDDDSTILVSFEKYLEIVKEELTTHAVAHNWDNRYYAIFDDILYTQLESKIMRIVQYFGLDLEDSIFFSF